MAASQTGARQQWSILMTLFTETKKIYTDNFPFLSAQNLELSGKAEIHTIKKANLATFACSLFGGREDIGFEYLHDWFLETFSIDGTKLSKPQAQLFIDLKTQAYISAVTSDKASIVHRQRNPLDILNALFPSDLDRYLLHRRSGATQLTAIERQFLEQVRVQRGTLLEKSSAGEGIDRLPSTYAWETFLSAIQSYIKNNFDELMGNIVSLLPVHQPVISCF